MIKNQSALFLLNISLFFINFNGYRLAIMVRLEGLEPPTFGTGIQRSIQLSYRRNLSGRKFILSL